MDKLEKHIKQKLEKREITPSPRAWDRISEGLGTETRKSANKTYWWMVAAGFAALVVLSLGILINNEDPLEGSGNSVLVEGKNTTVNESENQLGTLPENKATVSVREERAAIESEVPESGMAIKEITHQNQNTTDELVALKETPQEKVLEVPLKDKIIEDKLEEVLAQVNDMENNAITVSDAEIDSLLMVAQRELLATKVFKEDGKVDAVALLNEVEMELYDDARNPLFIKLREGFFKLRTAVADRNN